jgi:hypothetical protein
MDGDNITRVACQKNGIIVMGNEANGISKELEALSPSVNTSFRICSMTEFERSNGDSNCFMNLKEVF